KQEIRVGRQVGFQKRNRGESPTASLPFLKERGWQEKGRLVDSQGTIPSEVESLLHRQGAPGLPSKDPGLGNSPTQNDFRAGRILDGFHRDPVGGNTQSDQLFFPEGIKVVPFLGEGSRLRNQDGCLVERLGPQQLDQRLHPTVSVP